MSIVQVCRSPLLNVSYACYVFSVPKICTFNEYYILKWLKLNVDDKFYKEVCIPTHSLALLILAISNSHLWYMDYLMYLSKLCVCMPKNVLIRMRLKKSWYLNFFWYFFEVIKSIPETRSLLSNRIDYLCTIFFWFYPFYC